MGSEVGRVTDRLTPDEIRAREDRIILLFLAVAVRAAREKAQAERQRRARMHVVAKDEAA